MSCAKRTSGSDTYRVRIVLQDLDRDGDFTDTPLLSADDTRHVVIEKNGATVVDDDLTKSAATALTTDSGTDLLSTSSYEGSPNVGAVDVDDGSLIINEINGRVEVETTP